MLFSFDLVIKCCDIIYIEQFGKWQVVQNLSATLFCKRMMFRQSLLVTGSTPH